MKVLRFEAKKFFLNKFLVVFFLLLLVCDAALTVYYVNEKNAANEYIDKTEVEEVFALYLSDREAFMKEFNAISALQSEFVAKGDFSSDEYKAISKKATAFRNVLHHIDYIEKFDKNIDVFIKTAERNKLDYISVGISPDSYLYRYQDCIIEIYSKVKNVKIEFELIKGWDDYFRFSIPNLLIIVYLLIAVPCIVLAEDNTGLKQIIHTTKYGRMRLYNAKYLFCIIISVVTSILFLGLPLLAIYFTTGFSSIHNSVQAIDYFFVNPLPISIGRFLLVSFGVKILAFIGLAAVVMLLSILFRRVTHTFVASLAFCGLSYYLSTITYTNLNSPIRVLNLFFITASEKFFARYLGVNVFGYCVPHYGFTVAVCALFLIAAGIVGGLLFVKFIRMGVMSKKLKIPLKIPVSLRNGVRSWHKRIVVKNLYGYEFYKLLLANKTILIILLFVMIKVLVNDSAYGVGNSFEDEIYKDYMVELEGEMTEEKRQYIREERQRLNEIIAQKSIMDSQFQSGIITSEEYSKYYSQYNVAEIKSKVFFRVEQHAAYIDRMALEGKTAHFVYDTGWNHMFFAEFDFVLFLLFLLLFSGAFADEYRSGFDQLLKSTKKGRDKTFKAKFITCGITALVFTLAFAALDIVYLFNYNYLPAPDAPLVSIERFEAAASCISIQTYAVLMFVVRIVGFMLLYLIITSVSELMRKNITVLGTVTIATILPYMLVKFGLQDAGYISLPGILSATDYFLLSAKAGVIGDFGLLILFLALVTALCALLIRRSYRTFCNL